MATTSDRPNVLHIVPHDLGDWLGDSDLEHALEYLRGNPV